MRIAHVADRLDARHSVARVRMISDDIRRDRLCERWPPRAGFELRRRIEQQRAAAFAFVSARFEQPAHLRTERHLRARLAGDAILIRRQLRTPFSGRLCDLVIGRRIAVLRSFQNVSPFEHHFYIIPIERNLWTTL